MRTLSTIPTRERRDFCPPRGRERGAAPRHVAVDLSPRAVERIAAQVVQLLNERGAQDEPALISAGELAHRLRVERPWVYRYRHQLGGIRIGAGPKAPWRFEYGAAVEALRELQAAQGGEGGWPRKASPTKAPRKEEL